LYNSCDHCNVKSYLKRLEVNSLLTDETLNDEMEKSNDNEEEYEIPEDERISLEFINSIKNW